MKLKSLSDSTLLFSVRTNFCCEWSDDDKIFIVNEDGIDVHHFRPNPNNKQKQPAFDRSFIYPLTANPMEYSGFNEEFLGHLPREDVFRALSNALVAPHFVVNPVSYTKALWSSDKVLSSKNCLLAALNCLGNITIWFYQGSWSILLDVSHTIYLHLQQNNTLLSDRESSYHESLNNIIKNSRMLACTAMTWSNDAYVGNAGIYSYFVTGQKNGDVYILTLVPDETEDDIKLNINVSFVCSTDFGEICDLCWITHSENCYLLIIGTVKGIVSCMCIKKQEYNLEFVKMNSIWSEEDDLSIGKMAAVKWDERRHLILIVKGQFLISCLVDDECTSSHVQHKNLGNFKITGLQKTNDKEFYLCTMMGVLYRIDVKADVNNLPQLSISIVDVEFNCKQYIQTGLCVSRNKSLWLHFMTPSKRVAKLHGKKWSKYFVTYNEEIDTLHHLLNNDSHLLTNYWDILELVRILKVQNLYQNPRIDFIKDIKNCSSLYFLKLCFWLNTIWQSDVESEGLLKELSRRILSQHATNHLKTLAKKYLETESLTGAELETINLQYKLISEGNTDNLDCLLSLENLPQIVKRCEWCEEELLYPLCSQNHQREFCCVTYRDIDSNKFLLCFICNAVANYDLKKENPLCSFCDSRLKYLPICVQQAEDSEWAPDDSVKHEVTDDTIISNVENSEIME